MVAIDMEMPKGCYECDLCRGHICKATGTDIVANPKDNCPLVEIVTCKDCKYRDKVHPSYLSNKKDEVYFCTLQSDECCYEVEDDFYCCDAERRK